MELCECNSGNPVPTMFFNRECYCCMGTGPAAFEIVRNNRHMKVCSRCDLNSDIHVGLVASEDDLPELEEYDAAGARSVRRILDEKEEKDGPTIR